MSRNRKRVTELHEPFALLVKKCKALTRIGIDALCSNDEDVNKLISPRKDEVISLLERYIKEIEAFNKAYGLVKYENTDELIIRHILDSLAPLGIISRLLVEHCSLLTAHCSLKIADAGSGAGLPGIPLAIALPACEFTLIERMGRRAGFLMNTIAVLGLTNVRIEEKELERIENDQYDLITFRAFSPLEPKIVKTLYKVCKETGIIAAYKGKKEEIDKEIETIKKNNDQIKIIPYKTPFLEAERHLVVLA